MFPIIEKFLSMDGEGPTAGELATFVRFQGCRILRCLADNATYSFGGDQVTEQQTAQEIYDYIRENPARNVTLTGGEPLLQSGIEALLELLNQQNFPIAGARGNQRVCEYPAGFRKRSPSDLLCY